MVDIVKITFNKIIMEDETNQQTTGNGEQEEAPQTEETDFEGTQADESESTTAPSPSEGFENDEEGEEKPYETDDGDATAPSPEGTDPLEERSEGESAENSESEDQGRENEESE